MLIEELDEESEEKDDSFWYTPGEEIKWAWFEEEQPDCPPYERIFFCNSDNDAILEFEINRAKADMKLDEHADRPEFDKYPRPKSEPMFYARKNSTTMDDPKTN